MFWHGVVGGAGVGRGLARRLSAVAQEAGAEQESGHASVGASGVAELSHRGGRQDLDAVPPPSRLPSYRDAAVAALSENPKAVDLLVRALVDRARPRQDPGRRRAALGSRRRRPQEGARRRWWKRPASWVIARRRAARRSLLPNGHGHRWARGCRRHRRQGPAHAARASPAGDASRCWRGLRRPSSPPTKAAISSPSPGCCSTAKGTTNGEAQVGDAAMGYISMLVRTRLPCAGSHPQGEHARARRAAPSRRPLRRGSGRRAAVRSRTATAHLRPAQQGPNG